MYLQYRTPLPAAPRPRSFLSAVLAGVGAVILGVGLIVIVEPDQLVAATLIGSILAVLALIYPQAAIAGGLAYLAFLGDIRRYVAATSGVAGKDPLLLVGPVLVGAILVSSFIRRAFHLQTRLSKLVLALMLVMVLQMFNPKQGGMETGVAGALFYLVPLLWFWAGQAWGSDRFVETIIYQLVVPIAVLAAALGIVQTMWGFLHFEADAMRIMNTSAIVAVTRSPRPFGFFVSPAEYAYFVTAALAASIAPLAMGKFRIALMFAPLLVIAVLLFGGKGPVLALLFSLVIMWAVQARTASAIVGRGLLTAVVGIAGAAYLSTQAQQLDLGDTVQPYINREAETFTNVQGTDAGFHGQMFLSGIYRGIVDPLGEGLGASTFVGANAGAAGSTEVDISNMFTSLGIVGGALYGIVIITVVQLALRNWQNHRKLADLAIGVMLATQSLQWLTGSHYALAALCWFLIGTADATSMTPSPVQGQPFPARRSLPASYPALARA